MPTRTLALKTATPKYGLVRVFNPDGTINRVFRITTAEYAALTQKNAGPPAGVLPGERWLCGLKTYDLADMNVEQDGTIIIKAGETTEGEAYLKITPDEYTGVPPVITLTQAAIDRINLLITIKITITKIENGVVTWQSR